MSDTRTDDDLLTSTEVCRLVGITYRQLDYWVRNGAVESPANRSTGSGHHRQWTYADVHRLKVVADRTREARAILDSFANGSLWRESVA